MALKISVGLSTQRDPILAAKEAAQKAKEDFHKDTADLAIVFSSCDLSSENLLKVINMSCKSTHLIGSSGLGIISNQGIFRHGVIVMLLGLEENMHLASACVKYIQEKSALACGEELGENLLANFKNIRRDLSLIFSDGLIPANTELINGIQRSLGMGMPLLGASASDNFNFDKTYIYFKDEVLDNAAAGLLWGGKLNFGFGIKHGWRPLGKPHRITKSEGNTAAEIDGRPAALLYEDYFGKKISELKKELKRISIFYPIGIKLEEEKEFLLRNIHSINQDNSITFQGNIPENSQIRLMIGTKETCLNAASEAAQEAKKGLRDHQCKFVLVFDSASRYILLGRHARKELDIIKKEFGQNTPIIGVYTYGEQAPLKGISYLGKSYFHNQTINILAVGG